MEANALVKALILSAEVLEEDGHGPFLVVGGFKVVREAAPGEFCRELWHVARRSADGSDPGTCKSMAVW